MSSKLEKHCLLCDELISTEIDSREHVIPNAIGGKKKVSGFLCVCCNSKSGDNWDSEFARQMHPLSLLFRIKRDRGNVPSLNFETSSGGELILNSDGSMNLPDPVFEKKKNDKGVEINISARSMDEARKMLKSIGRKNPQLNVDELLQQAKVESRYTQDPVKFILPGGGLVAGRSYVKTALALLSTTDINVRACEHAMSFLREEESEPCFGYYYERDLVVGRPRGVPIHLVQVNGDPDSNLIRGYVEYFGFMRIVMCLSSNYSGRAFTASYAIDPTTGKELNLFADLDLTLVDIRKAYAYEKYDGNAVQQAISDVVGPTLEAQYEEEKKRVLEEAVRYAFANCGAKEGEELNEEQLKVLEGLLLEKIEPWVLHQLRRRG